MLRLSLIRMVLLSALSLAGAANAAGVAVFSVGYPDISVDTLTVTYNATTDAFFAGGNTNNLRRDATGTNDSPIGNGDFKLGLGMSAAGILDSTVKASGELYNIVVRGLLDPPFPPVGTVNDLLFADVTTFLGFKAAGVLQFLATVKGGDLVASGEFAVGDEVGLILNTGDSSFIDWTKDIDTNAGGISGSADLAYEAVASPSTWTLFGMLGLLSGLKWRQSSRRRT